MKVIIAANQFSKIKAKVLSEFLRKPITPTMLSGLANGTEKERMAFNKCTLFFTDKNFKKFYESLVPKYFTQYNNYYDSIYNGVLRILGNDFNEFFDKKFQISEIKENNAEYDKANSKFGGLHFIQKLKDITSSLYEISKQLKGNNALEKKISGTIHDFETMSEVNGVNGIKSIDSLYEIVNSATNSLGGTCQSKLKILSEEAWSSIGEPVLSKGKYECYCVKKFQDLNAVAGFTRWCVAQNGTSGWSYFDGCGGKKPDKGYILPNYDENGNKTEWFNDKKNAYYLICKNKAPVALFNISKDGTCQFKNTDDDPIQFDRPSSKDIIGIGNELRKMLGINSYEQDFSIFKEYEENLDKNEEIDLSFSVYDIEDNPKLICAPSIKEAFVKSLENGDGNYYEILSENPDLLQYESIRNAFVNGLENGDSYCYQILSNNPDLAKEFLSIPSVKEAFVKKLENGNRYYDDILSNNPDLLQYESIRNVFANGLKNGYGYYILSQHLDLLQYESIRNAFVKSLENGDSNCYYFLSKNPDLAKEFLSIPSVKEAFVNGFENGDGYCYYILSKNPDLAKEFLSIPSVKEAFVKKLENGNDSSVLSNNPDLLQYESIREVFVKSLENGDGYCYEILSNNLDLLQYESIRNAFVNGFENEDRYCYDVLSQHPDLLQYESIRNAFVKSLENGYGNYYEILSENPGLLQDKLIRNAFVKSLENGYGNYFLSKNPDLAKEFLSIPSVKEAFVNGLEKGIGYYDDVLSQHLDLLQDKLIRNAFVNGLGEEKSYCYKILSNNPNLLQYESIRNVFVKKLEKGNSNCYDILSKNPDLAKEFLSIPSVKEAFVKKLENGYGYCYYILSNNPNLLQYESIRNVFVKKLENGYGYDFLSQLPDLAKEFLSIPSVKEAFVNGFENGNSNCYDILSKNPDLAKEFLSIPSVKEAFVKKLENGYGYDILSQLPDLLQYESIRNVFVKKLENGDSNCYDILSKNPDLAKEFLSIPSVKEAFVNGFENGSYYCYGFLSNNPDLLQDKLIRNVFVKSLEKGNSNCYEILSENPGLLQDKLIMEVFVKKLEEEKGCCYDILSNNPSLSEDTKIKSIISNAYGNDGYYAYNYKISNWLKKTGNESVETADINDLVRMSKSMFTNYHMCEHLLEHDKIEDEHKLFSLCKHYANKRKKLLLSFFDRFHDLYNPEGIQNDFWSYIENSNYLFDIIKQRFYDIPKDRMKRYLNSQDEDIRWIAEKTISVSGANSMVERKASVIANRIVKQERVANRIANKFYNSIKKKRFFV